MGAPDHILTILAVADLARAAEFYEAVFGWPRAVDVPVYIEYALPGGRGIGLYVREGFERNAGQRPLPVPPGEISGTELYIRCAHLEGVLARLRAAGARELSPLATRDWGDDVACFADPDANVLAVARPSAR